MEAARPSILARLGGYLRMERSPVAIPFLDGLRAFAILLVLGRHGTRVFQTEPDRWLPMLPVATGPDGRPLWDAAIPLANGWMGVDLFFVLSGFLITWHLLRRWAIPPRPGQVRRYVGKRLLRIVPAYYAFLFVVVAGLVPGYAPGVDFSDRDLGWRTLYHVLFLQDYLPADIVVAFWSLGVEEKFYLLAPLLLVPLMGIGSPRRRWLALGALFLVPTLARAATWLAVGPVTGYEAYFYILRSPFHASFDGLVAGTACALLYHQRERWGWSRAESGSRVPQLLAGAGALIVLAALLAQPRGLGPLSGFHGPEPLLVHVSAFDAIGLGAVLALGFAALMLGLLLAPEGRLHRLLGARSLLFFSKISYSLYLVHMVFMGSTRRWLEATTPFATWSVPTQLAAYLPVYTALSLAGALVLHYTVEQPFLRLKDRL